MTEKEKKYKAHYRNVGKHLFRDNEGYPINLKSHPVKVRDKSRYGSEVLVNYGWGINYGRGIIEVPFDINGAPQPYKGFWEARCRGCLI